jgi:hypothetical protein
MTDREEILALLARNDVTTTAASRRGRRDEQARKKVVVEVEVDVDVEAIEVVSAQQALVLATARTLAADQQQEIADKTYVPAFRDVERFRAWEVEEDIARAARRKARTATWEATRKFLALNK